MLVCSIKKMKPKFINNGRVSKINKWKDNSYWVPTRGS